MRDPSKGIAETQAILDGAHLFGLDEFTVSCIFYPRHDFWAEDCGLVSISIAANTPRFVLEKVIFQRTLLADHFALLWATVFMCE